ncbi:MAG: rRNA maturation RNase YbeY [bacterium]|nr:rRNA maturation RNase YbeY [bacterium]
MNKIFFLVDARYPINKDRIQKIADKTLNEMKVISDVELSVSVVGDRKMKSLNFKYRGYPNTTDVLSFPLEETSIDNGFVSSPDQILRLGDIVISYPQAIVNAIEYNKMVDDEIDMLVSHSILHLLGIHHEGD